MVILKTYWTPYTMKIKIIIEILHAMNKMFHKNGMMHRDLKIESIILNSSFQAKLVDFGFVRITEYAFNEVSLTKGNGTFTYISHEMLNEEKYDNKTDDIFFWCFIARHIHWFNTKTKFKRQNIR